MSETEKVPCTYPGCDFKAKGQRGLRTHERLAHLTVREPKPEIPAWKQRALAYNPIKKAVSQEGVPKGKVRYFCDADMRSFIAERGADRCTICGSSRDELRAAHAAIDPADLEDVA